MSFIYDVAIIGAGASGILSAISADKNSNGNKKIALLEKEDKIGKKILATGNGRCNFTNMNINSDFYFGSCKYHINNILQKYNSKYIINYFQNLGLLSNIDNFGRVYPYTNSATSVVDVLKSHCNKDNIDIFLNFEVISIKKQSCKNTYTISSSDDKIECKKIIISTGGQAGVNKYTGSGYTLLDNLNIKQNSLYPSLCPINVKNNIIKSLKGCRAYGKITLSYYIDDMLKNISEIGEIQFTDKSLSGICIFNISRFVNEFNKYKTINNIKATKLRLSLDLFPDLSSSELETTLYNKIQYNNNNEISSLMYGILHYKIANALFKDKKINKDAKINTLSKAQIKNLVKIMKFFEFEIFTYDDFKRSQVTCGGIKSSECNFNDLSYVNDKNIYFTGELLDIDGLCGGYNLHWAWVSGIIAGENSVK